MVISVLAFLHHRGARGRLENTAAASQSRAVGFLLVLVKRAEKFTGLGLRLLFHAQHEHVSALLRLFRDATQERSAEQR